MYNERQQEEIAQQQSVVSTGVTPPHVDYLAKSLPPLVNTAMPVGNVGSPMPAQIQPAGAVTNAFTVNNGGMRQGEFLTQPFQAGAAVIQLRPKELRTYFFIQNLSGANMLIGFGFIPSLTNGLILTPNTAYEPFTVPTNEIFVLGAGVAQNGLLMYSTDNAQGK